MGLRGLLPRGLQYQLMQQHVFAELQPLRKMLEVPYADG